jgi:O-antigen/teichoic acid export membrane protein
LRKFNMLRLSQNKNLASALGSSYGLMALTMGIQFVLVPLYLHSMGKETFGVLTMMLASISYGAIGITWLSGGMARILGERGATNDRAALAKAYSFSKWVFVGYAIITIAIFWLIAPWVLTDSLKKPDLRQALIFISIYFLLIYEYNTDRLTFNALCRQTAGNVIEAAGQVVFAASVAVGLYLGGGLVSVVIALIAGVITARSLAWMYWHRQNMALGWRWPYLLDAAPMWQRVSGRMGRHYAIYGVLLLTLQADVLIVGWLAGPGGAAVYYLLWRIPEVCILLLGRIPGVFAPHLIQMDSRGETAQIHQAYHKGFRILMGLSALAGLGYGLLGNWFVNFWVGNNAPDGLTPYVLAGIALFFVSAIQWPASTAYALVNTGPLVKVTALYLAIKLGVFTLLFGKLDYLAPLVAIIASHVLGVFFFYFKVGKEACRINHRSI